MEVVGVAGLVRRESCETLPAERRRSGRAAQQHRDGIRIGLSGPINSTTTLRQAQAHSTFDQHAADGDVEHAVSPPYLIRAPRSQCRSLALSRSWTRRFSPGHRHVERIGDADHLQRALCNSALAISTSQR